MKKIFLFICFTALLTSCKDKKAEEPAPPEQKMTTTPQQTEAEALAEAAEYGIAVDLQAVSVDPLRPTISVGSQTTIVSNIKNNGPDNIPVGEAVVHITVNGKYLNKPAGFKSDRWELDTIYTNSVSKNYEVWVRNSKAVGVNEPGWPGFKFTVKGKTVGSGDITLTSSLSGNATASDYDGANQSARTVLIIK